MTLISNLFDLLFMKIYLFNELIQILTIAQWSSILVLVSWSEKSKKSKNVAWE